jgi:hypothetical protein
LAGAATTTLALAEPFIASDAAVAFSFFFPTEKGLGPRGYERTNIHSKKISYLILTKKSALTSPLNPLQRGTCTTPKIPVQLTAVFKNML